MKMKKLSYKIFITVFAMILVLPTVVQLIAGEAANKSEFENRNLAEFPKLSAATYKTFSEDFNTWYDDHLPLRNQLIFMNASVDYHVFKDSPSDTVVLGKNNWLFYGEDVAHCLGRDELSEGQINDIVRKVKNAKNVLKSQGMDFVLYIVPDKGRVYTEYVPDYVNKYRAQENSTDALLLALKKACEEDSELKVIFPYDEISAYKDDNPAQTLYGKCDTHWNTMGAYIGAEGFLKAVGESIPPLKDQSIIETRTSNYDLTGVIYTYVSGDTEYAVDYELTDYSKNNLDEVNGFEYIPFTPDESKKNIFISRDSFALAMSDFVAPLFNDSTWVHHDFFDENQVFEKHNDIYAYECIERNCYKMLDWDISAFSEEEEEVGDIRKIKLSALVPQTEDLFMYVVESHNDENGQPVSNVITESFRSLSEGVEFEEPVSQSGVATVIVLNSSGKEIENRDIRYGNQ